VLQTRVLAEHNANMTLNCRRRLKGLNAQSVIEAMDFIHNEKNVVGFIRGPQNVLIVMLSGVMIILIRTEMNDDI
jgi:hypothetical protein